MQLIGPIINLFVILVIIGLGFLVFRKKSDGATNVTFFIFTILFAAWLFFNFWETYTDDINWATLFLYLDFTTAPFMIYSLFLFLINFPYPAKNFAQSNVWRIIFFLPAFLFSILAIFGQVIYAPVFLNDKIRFSNGPAYWPYAIAILFYGFIGLATLVRRYKRSVGRTKMQIGYVLFAFTFVMIVLAVVNLFLQNLISNDLFRLINNVSVVVVISVAYAVIKHRLMDIKIIVRAPGVYFFCLFTILMADILLFRYVVNLSLTWQLFFDSLIVVTSIIVFPPLKKFYYYLANRYFFYTLYDARKVVSEISDKLLSCIEIKDIGALVYEILAKNFRFKSFCLLKYDGKENEYRVAYCKNTSLKFGQIIAGDFRLQENYFAEGKVFTREDCLGYSDEGRGQGFIAFMKKKFEIASPLSSKNGVIGLILLGVKESEDMYTEGDLKLLRIIALQISAAMENADLYAKVNDLNRSLERKVREQTVELKAKADELQQKNEKLEKLLQIKNDFLRVVNHQLNTPLSIIKNSIFMIKSGSFSLNKGLGYVEEEVKQLENLFSDFWKAFSFVGGAIQLNLTKINIEEIIDSMIENVKQLPLVQERKLKILVEKNLRIPKVKNDPKQIVQVINNLLQNSISYTKSGWVKVYFKNINNKFLKVFVADTGCGIDEEDKGRIFEKFIRGQRAIQERPSGSGLGLYIAKNIIEASGGELKLEKSEVDKGSTFSFTVPIWK